MDKDIVNFCRLATMYEVLMHTLISFREWIPEEDNDFLEAYDAAIAAAMDKIHDYMNKFNAGV